MSIINNDFLAKLRPALAGFFIDEKIEYPEVIATIVDLIQRGYIGYHDGKVFFVKTGENLLYYEKEIMRELFSGEIVNNYKKGLDKFLDYNTIIAFAKLDAVRLGFAEYYYFEGPIISMFLSKNRYGTKQFLYQKLPFYLSQSPILKAYFAIFVASLLFFGLSLIIPSNLHFLLFIFGILLYFSIIIVAFLTACLTIFLLLLLYYSIFVKQLNVEVRMLPQWEKEKQKYLELKSFIKANPHIENLDVSRDLLPYKIAFGINTVWNEFLDKATIENTSKFQTFGKYKISYGSVGVLNLNLDDKNIIRICPMDKDIYTIELLLNKEFDNNLSGRRIIGKIIKESIFMNADFQQDNILILSGKPTLNGKPLVFDYSLVSNSIEPIANYFTSVKNRNLNRRLDILMPLTKNDIILVFAFFYINFVAIPRKSILKLQKT